MTSPASSTIEQRSLERGEPLPSEKLATDVELPPRWRRAGGCQERTVWTLWEGGARVLTALEVHRPGSAYSKIAGPILSRTNDDDGPPPRVADLLAAIETEARARGHAVLKWEDPPDVRHEWLTQLGWQPVEPPSWPESLERAGHPAVRGALRWLAEPPRRAPIYLHQTSGFTCGPATLLMGASVLEPGRVPRRDDEMDLYRRATTWRGCDPLGLALAAHDAGFSVRVSMSTADTVLTEDVSDEAMLELLSYTQARFRRESESAGIEVTVENVDLAKVSDALRAGAVVLLLIDLHLLHGRHTAHWILVHDHLNRPTSDEPLFIVSDPWTDTIRHGESWLDGHLLPLRASTLQASLWVGEPRYNAMVVMSRDSP